MSKTRIFDLITTPLSYVGRMALTNYLSHTLICTTFFYGYGFGNFGSIDFPQMWVFIGSVWAFNIVFSMVWLRFFKMGPLEWAWRVCTYRQVVPIKRS